ncbi:hypothetical protein [Chitinophaga arvensicola]|nr:hypothetical protein [Chitinophaga arvensicola]
MSQHTISEFKAVCIDEASIHHVPPALIEVMLIKLLFKRESKYLIREYLKDGALYRLLTNLYGPFTVLLNFEQPTIKFENGFVIGSNYEKNNIPASRWESLLFHIYMEIQPEVRDRIITSLTQKINQVLFPVCALNYN